MQGYYDLCSTCGNQFRVEDLEPVEPDGRLMCDSCWESNGRPERYIPPRGDQT